MALGSLAAIEQAIRDSWSRETCDPVDLEDWSPGNPARGQCGITALVVRDFLGGDVLIGEVHHADGSRQGVHYWNRLAGGIELDLTREQFTRGEVVGTAKVAELHPHLDAGRLAEQYRLLSERVAERLKHSPAESSSRR